MVFTKLILRSAGKSWSQTHDSSYTSAKPVILQMKKLFTPILISRKMKIFPVCAQGYKITLWKGFHLRVPTFAGCVSVTIFHQNKGENLQPSKLFLSQRICVPDIFNEDMKKTVAEELISLSSPNTKLCCVNKAQSIPKIPLILPHPLFPTQMLDPSWISTQRWQKCFLFRRERGDPWAAPTFPKSCWGNWFYFATGTEQTTCLGAFLNCNPCLSICLGWTKNQDYSSWLGSHWITQTCDKNGTNSGKRNLQEYEVHAPVLLMQSLDFLLINIPAGISRSREMSPKHRRAQGSFLKEIFNFCARQTRLQCCLQWRVGIGSNRKRKHTRF